VMNYRTCPNKKYSDSVWKEKKWEQIDEELKKIS